MLKIYILLLLVLSFGYGYLVEDVIERYENGYLKKVNYYERIFINEYENQILVKERAYYKNGQLEYEYNYKDGKENGRQVAYYENGQLEYEYNYKDGKENGRQVVYRKNGQMYSIKEYENGGPINMWFDYFKDGTLRREYKYDLTNEMEYQKFYNEVCPGDVLWLHEYSYFNGYHVDKQYKYYCNGNVWMEGMYFDGYPQGKFIYYYDNGNKSHEGKLDETESPTGHWIYYHENGNKSHEGEYCDGSEYGIWKDYDLEGNFVKSRDYGECDDWDDW